MYIFNSVAGAVLSPVARHRQSRAHLDQVHRQRHRSLGPDCHHPHSHPAAQGTECSGCDHPPPQSASSIPPANHSGIISSPRVFTQPGPGAVTSTGKFDFIRFMIRVRSLTSFSRSRLGRFASSSSIVGIDPPFFRCSRGVRGVAWFNTTSEFHRRQREARSDI